MDNFFEWLIKDQEHEWKPRSLTFYLDSLKQAEKENNLNNADIPIIQLLEKVLNDDMKDIWLWLKRKINKQHLDLTSQNNDWYFGIFGNIVFHHIVIGSQINKWDSMSIHDLNKYVQEIKSNLNNIISKINNSPININAIILGNPDELHKQCNTNDDFLNIDDEQINRYFPSFNLDTLLVSYVKFIEKELSIYLPKRTYEKPRKSNNDKFIRRNTFINSMYDLTTSQFNSPHHDFVSKISRYILDDDDIDVSSVRAIYNRRKKVLS